MSQKPDNMELEHAVREHLPKALVLAVRLTGDPHQAEDLVQEALLRVARSWPSFRGECQFWTWFVRIVINVFRSRLSKSPRSSALPAVDATSSEDAFDDPLDYREVPPEQEILTEELAQTIAARVSALPPRQREVITLISYEGFTTQEAARVLETSVDNIYATLHQARRRLRRELTPYLTNS